MQSKNLIRKIVHKATVGQQLTFDEAVQYLYEGLPVSTAAVFRGGAGLIRAKHFYKMLGAPEEQYKSIHIAGTSGKGSVAHIMSHLLREHGFRVGTFTSPHAYDIRERALLNGEMIPRMEFAQITSEVVSHILKMQQSRHGPATFFEVIAGISFRAFADNVVDYAVIETGLGGRYDATNVIERSDKFAILTALGLDHTEILGNTLPEIAFQKAGILPTSGQAVAWNPDDIDTRSAIAKTAQDRHTEISYVSSDIYTMKSVEEDGIIFDYHSKDLHITDLKLSLYGEHQAQNASLALQSLELLAQRDNFTIDPTSVRRALAHIFIPARFERVTEGERQIIFDGAHNPQKIGAFIEALVSSGIKKADWVLALKYSKDVKSVLQIIQPYVDTLYTTTFLNSHKDMAIFNAVPAEELAEIAHAVGITHVQAVPDCRDAFELAYSNSNDAPIVVSGSFYLAGDLRGHRLANH